MFFLKIEYDVLFDLKQNNRKRKTHSSSGPANSAGTGNTVGPSPGSPQSTHTPGDGMAPASSLQHVNNVSKSMMMYGADGARGIGSSANQLVSGFVYIHLDDSLNKTPLWICIFGYYLQYCLSCNYDILNPHLQKYVLNCKIIHRTWSNFISMCFYFHF